MLFDNQIDISRGLIRNQTSLQETFSLGCKSVIPNSLPISNALGFSHHASCGFAKDFPYTGISFSDHSGTILHSDKNWPWPTPTAIYSVGIYKAYLLILKCYSSRQWTCIFREINRGFPLQGKDKIHEICLVVLLKFKCKYNPGQYIPDSAVRHSSDIPPILNDLKMLMSIYNPLCKGVNKRRKNHA